ncbi:MAG: hypothetical protein RBQ97_05725 [Acholeplasma sp.]|nr:hypothetical protein [Acholeplasma sp.]
MKKLIVIMLSILLFFSGCKTSGFIEVDTKTVNDKLENSDTFILYMGLSYCSACKIFRSVVKSSIDKENFDVFYLEFDKVPEKDQELLTTTITSFLEQNETFPYSFPILFVIKDGVILDQFSLQQADTEDKFIKRINNSGIFE